MKDNISNLLDISNEHLDITLDTIIKYKFPKIKNLTVKNGLVTFEENGYTKEDVESFINEVSTKDY